MRTMSIPPFPDRVEIADFESFTNARLAGEFRLSQQGSALAGYMFYPPAKRSGFRSGLRCALFPIQSG